MLQNRVGKLELVKSLKAGVAVIDINYRASPEEETKVIAAWERRTGKSVKDFSLIVMLLQFTLTDCQGCLTGAAQETY